MDEIHCIKNPIDFHPFLGEIPQAPKKLWFKGHLPTKNQKIVCIVGSRDCTKYGLDAVDRILKDLNKDIYIVSGLALGIDTEVHKKALEYNIKTIAFPGSGLSESVLYPHSNINLSREIINKGGALISEYEPDTKSLPWMFIKRNRLMAGISNAVIIVEAKEKSGTLVTARMALDYNKELGAVPGSIFAKSSQGANRLIYEGATPIRDSEDIHEILGLGRQNRLFEIKDYSDCTTDENIIIKSLEFLGKTSRDELFRKTNLDIAAFNTALSMLEIKSYILSQHGYFSLRN